MSGPEVIKENDQVILRREKKLQVFQVKKKRQLFLDKFKFILDGIIGHPFGTTFELKEGQLVKIDALDGKDVGKDIDESCSGKDNRELIAGDSNQKLTQQDIEAMKQKGIAGQDIIQQLVENSDTFKTKTEFSQAKYLKKKRKKHVFIVTVLKPTARLLIEMLYSKAPDKICNLRVDSLSQILCYGNIHAGINVAVVDSCRGLVVGSILERMGGYGKIVQLYPGTDLNRYVVDYFDFPKQYREMLFSFPLNKLMDLKANSNAVNEQSYKSPSEASITQIVTESSNPLGASHIKPEVESSNPLGASHIKPEIESSNPLGASHIKPEVESSNLTDASHIKPEVESSNPLGASHIKPEVESSNPLGASHIKPEVESSYLTDASHIKPEVESSNPLGASHIKPEVESSNPLGASHIKPEVESSNLTDASHIKTEVESFDPADALNTKTVDMDTGENLSCKNDENSEVVTDNKAESRSNGDDCSENMMDIKDQDCVKDLPPECKTSDIGAQKKEGGKRPQKSLDEKQEEQKQKAQQLEAAKAILLQRNIDCLIVASKYHPTPLVMNLLEFMAPARPVVVYSQYKEPLVDCYTVLKASGLAVKLKLTETWFREYQVLPARTHPTMQMTGTGGYLLTFTLVQKR